MAGEKVLQYLERVESETESLNRECRQANSSNCQGEQSMIRTIRKGLAHLPDCVALFKQLALEKIISYAGIKVRFVAKRLRSSVSSNAARVAGGGHI